MKILSQQSVIRKNITSDQTGVFIADKQLPAVTRGFGWLSSCFGYSTPLDLGGHRIYLEKAGLNRELKAIFPRYAAVDFSGCTGKEIVQLQSDLQAYERVKDLAKTVGVDTLQFDHMVALSPGHKAIEFAVNELFHKALSASESGVAPLGIGKLFFDLRQTVQLSTVEEVRVEMISALSQLHKAAVEPIATPLQLQQAEEKLRSVVDHIEEYARIGLKPPTQFANLWRLAQSRFTHLRSFNAHQLFAPLRRRYQNLQKMDSGNSTFASEVMELLSDYSLLCDLGLVIGSKEQKALSLLRARIPKRPFSIAAAKKGQALRAGVDGMLHHVNFGHERPLVATPYSVQKVYLSKQSGAVFKKSSFRAAAEESLIDSMMEILMGGDSGVPQMAMGLLQPQRFGIHVGGSSLEVSRRGTCTTRPMGKGVVAKPFLQDLELFEHLHANRKEGILQRLTLDSRMRAWLTLDLQFVDLHSRNLGFTPLLPSESDALYKQEFQVSEWGETCSFKRLQTLFLQGHLSPDTVVTFGSKNGAKTQLPLNQHPQLWGAINAPWELQLFDCDGVMLESNQLLRDDEDRLTIPLRSHLLATSWKDKPLSASDLEALERIDSRQQQLLDWMDNRDAPFLKALRPEARLEIVKHLQGIEKRGGSFSNGAGRLSMPEAKGRYAQLLSFIWEKDESLWKKIESSAFLFATLPAETGLLEYAEAEGIAFERLCQLNPVIEPRPFIEPVRIKIPRYREGELTAPLGPIRQKEAQQKRLAIIMKLLPRVTHRQKQAYVERVRARQRYLNDFSWFRKRRAKTESEQNFLNRIHKFLSRYSERICSKKLDEVAKQLGEGKNLNALHQELVAAVQPTYFNLAKVMYPLLGPSYELQVILKGNRAGRFIGEWREPLDETLDAVHKYLKSGTVNSKIISECSLEKDRERLERLYEYLRQEINNS